MKTKFTIFFLIAITVCHLFSQNRNFGIYKNWQDYKDGRLTYVINPDSSEGKIKLHHFFSGKYIELINGEKKYRFNKDSIFGYRDSKLRDYRFYKKYDQEYLIKGNKAIVIYSLNVPVVSSTGKTAQLVPTYFFSTKLNSEILPLTVLNLKRAFPENLKLHDMLDLEFSDRASFYVNDIEHRIIRINNLICKPITSQ